MTNNDFGYYFKLTSGEIKLIRNSLEENGFKDTTNNDWTVLWNIGVIKYEIYHCLTAY